MAFRLRTALLALPILGLAMSLACDDPDDELRSIDLAELPDRFACEDVTVVAATPDGSEALLIGVEDGLAAAARESGSTVEAEYLLPDDRLTVRWVAGANVYQGQCGRGSGGEWRLDDRRDAVHGTITVRLTPEADGGLSLSADLDALLLAPVHADGSPGSGDAFELAPTRLETLRVDD